MHRNTAKNQTKLKKIGKKDRRPKNQPSREEEGEEFDIQDELDEEQHRQEEPLIKKYESPE